jgi:hypothetical protein
VGRLAVESAATGQMKMKRTAMQDTRTGSSTVPRRMVQAQRHVLMRVCCRKGLSTAGGYKDLLLTWATLASHICLTESESVVD